MGRVAKTSISAMAHDGQNLTPVPNAISVNFLLQFFPIDRLINIVVTSSSRSVEDRLNRTSIGSFLCLGFSTLLGVFFIAAALWLWGAREVRGDQGEVFVLTLVGVVWLAISYQLFPWLGLNIRDDAIERQNHAALIASCSALISVSIAYAAGNLGEGPTYEENIFCAGLSNGGMFLLWLIYEAATHVSRSITEERDLASGFRFGGLLLAWGLILARAVTGNWHGANSAMHDFFHDGWLASIMCLVGIGVELLLKPSRSRPFPSWPSCGLLPGLVYVVAAAAYVWHLGRWEGMPQ